METTIKHDLLYAILDILNEDSKTNAYKFNQEYTYSILKVTDYVVSFSYYDTDNEVDMQSSKWFCLREFIFFNGTLEMSNANEMLKEKLIELKFKMLE